VNVLPGGKICEGLILWVSLLGTKFSDFVDLGKIQRKFCQTKRLEIQTQPFVGNENLNPLKQEQLP